ncbi:hypothetical protein BO71DRAFT_420144 [Aspergillus ellipticus CBS 707.79]|uniref:LYR motif-containing protein Cup1-like N-terminal domain-containing protein n=1 Tax=Aspergillus ellipticus CBS 707.79 TaxID=1448320 RepID=A0A319DGB6_9EURO|nr:hypothetical protein BO71DRAFT_420144 [Aspergillus ellipticus CBS 707.79]
MSSALHVPPETWRSLLRSLLRECSYLPDPVARVYMHADVLDRFRRHIPRPPKSKAKNKPKAATPKIPLKNDPLKQILLQRSATKQLSLLRRANEGYSKPLEEVLQMAYGRRGKRRKQLIFRMIAPHCAPTEETTTELEPEPEPAIFADGWRPPAIMVDLLKAQNHNPMITASNAGHFVKHAEPNIPEKNIWGKPIAPSRRRNMRKDWYHEALRNMFPPLPDAELEALDGLISGDIPWTPLKRRKSLEPPAPARSSLDVKFLTEGPHKEGTFDHFVDGRPHVLTRRFMHRLWKRISCLVPRQVWDARKKRIAFTWDVLHSGPSLSLPLQESLSSTVFQGIDATGRIIKDQPEKVEDMIEALSNKHDDDKPKATEKGLSTN